MTYSILLKPRAPWGDYGDILIHGMSRRRARSPRGFLQLERTGPFVPPVSFPGVDVLITDAFRKDLVAAGLSGPEFKAVDKLRIVPSDWHTWDQKAEDPLYYPDECEPENYVLGPKHSADLADEIGPLWELIVPTVARVKKNKQRKSDPLDQFVLVTDTCQGLDFVGVEGVSYVFVSDRAVSWLKQNAGPFVNFREVQQTGGATSGT